MEVSALREGVIKVALVGRLDSAGVDRIETRFLASIVPGGCSAIVDLSQVDFIASMGIRMITSAVRSLRARNASAALYGAQPLVREVLGMVNLGQVVPICSTEAEALAALAV